MDETKGNEIPRNGIHPNFTNKATETKLAAKD